MVDLLILKLAKNYLTKKPDAVKRLVFALFSYCIRERILHNLGCVLHLDVVAHARGGTSHLPCHSGVAVILVVKLMHPNQLFRRHSLSHSLLAGLGRTRSSLQLSIGVLHGLFPAFGEVTAEGLDLRVGAAKFLDHAVDLFQLHGVVPRYGDGLLVGIQDDFHGISPLFCAFSVETPRYYYCRR